MKLLLGLASIFCAMFTGYALLLDRATVHASLFWWCVAPAMIVMLMSTLVMYSRETVASPSGEKPRGAAHVAMLWAPLLFITYVLSIYMGFIPEVPKPEFDDASPAVGIGFDFALIFMAIAIKPGWFGQFWRWMVGEQPREISYTEA